MTPMVSVGVKRGDSDVFVTESVYAVEKYLRVMHDWHLTAADINAMWDLLDPESCVSGLSWTVGVESGYHLAFEIQAAEFAIVDMRGAL